MKEIEYCSECDRKLVEDDKERNRESGINPEEWTCMICDNDSNAEDDWE
jgi:hypothetical protein